MDLKSALHGLGSGAAARLQPSVGGTRGGATTLLYVVLIVVLWLSITRRIPNVRAALAQAAPAGEPQTQGTMPDPAPALPHRNADGSWSIPDTLPNLPGYTPPTGTIGGHH